LEFLIIHITGGGIRGVRHEDIYIMGHSIGTGVATRYAYNYREIHHGGLILISPYKSILTVVLDNKMAEYTSSSSNFYRTIDAIPEIPWPILVVHGVYDEIINISHSRKLVKANKKIEFYEVNSDHNMIIGNGIVHEIIRQFVN
jgi:pimeloyl-ACP methyl ester carboxylesterase